MEWRDRHLTVPFGWSVTHPGGTEIELEARVERLRNELEHALERVFEPAAGFQVNARAQGDGWSATVTREDFRGELTVAVDRTDRGRIRAVRVFGTGGSVRLPGLTAGADRLQRMCRTGGTVFGALVFGLLCWLSIGVYNPAFVLGGLLMAVVMIMTLVGGANIGGWIAERITQRRIKRLELGAVADAAFQGDLKRWRALSRQLGTLRASLTGKRRHQPFREDAGGLTSAFASSASPSS